MQLPCHGVYLKWAAIKTNTPAALNGHRVAHLHHGGALFGLQELDLQERKGHRLVLLICHNGLGHTGLVFRLQSQLNYLLQLAGTMVKDPHSP